MKVIRINYCSMISVVCLVMVDSSNLIFATQRGTNQSLANKWEFPGGKVENSEDFKCALRREIYEELNFDLNGELERLNSTEHHYDHLSVSLTPFLFRCNHRPEFELVEHQSFCWLALDNLAELDWAPADIPILKSLKNLIP